MNDVVEAPTPVSPPPVAPQRAQQSPLNFMIILTFLVLLGVGCLGGYYLGKNPNFLPKQQACTMEAKICPDGSSVGRSGPLCEFDPCPTTTPEDTAPASPTPAEFMKRLYDDTTKLVGSSTFPKEMTAIADTQLVGIRCSTYHYSDYEGKYFTENAANTNRPVEMTDPLLMSAVKTNPEISALSYCTSEKGATVLYYEMQSGEGGGGGGANTVAFFDTVSDSGLREEIARIPNDGAPYFGCRYPYMLTENNIFYWGCGGGDGGFGQSSIYALDLTKRTSRRIFKCSSSVDISDDNFENKAIVKCE